MNDNWKPGEVAQYDGSLDGRLFMTTRGWLDDEGERRDPAPELLRRLVVIDLPRGALAGWPVLIDALERAKEETGFHLVFGGLIEQIKAQTETKPEEPTGLGAVVEDEAGTRWVRAGSTHDDRLADNWRCVSGERVGWWSEYRNVAAVRVLSEGVTS